MLDYQGRTVKLDIEYLRLIFANLSYTCFVREICENGFMFFS